MKFVCVVLVLVGFAMGAEARSQDVQNAVVKIETVNGEPIKNLRHMIEPVERAADNKEVRSRLSFSPAKFARRVRVSLVG